MQTWYLCIYDLGVALDLDVFWCYAVCYCIDNWGSEPLIQALLVCLSAFAPTCWWVRKQLVLCFLSEAISSSCLLVGFFFPWNFSGKYLLHLYLYHYASLYSLIFLFYAVCSGAFPFPLSPFADLIIHFHCSSWEMACKTTRIADHLS